MSITRRVFRLPAGRRRTPFLSFIMLLSTLAAFLLARGAARLPVTPAGGGPIETASCAPESVAPAPLPREPGVYRAGPLLLVTGVDLGRLRARQLVRPSGSEAIVVLRGNRATVLSVDPESRGRFSLQFTPFFPGHPHAVISDGRPAVRFPTCGRTLHRFAGGVLLAGKGCTLLRVRPAGEPPIAMLIPIGTDRAHCHAALTGHRSTKRRWVGALDSGWGGCDRPAQIGTDAIAVLAD